MRARLAIPRHHQGVRARARRPPTPPPPPSPSPTSISPPLGSGRYELINPNPTVEIILDSKWKEGKDGKEVPDTVYAPKIKLTWFLERDYIQQFLNIVMPVLFIAVGSVVNSLTISGFYTTDYTRYADYLANALGLGLTLVFMVPSISKSESTKNEFGKNQFTVTVLFIGVILGSIGIHGERNSTKRWVCLFFNVASWMFLGAGIAVVGHNFFCYKKLTWRIKKHNKFTDKPCTDKEKGKESPYSFLGRPGTSGKNTKGSDVSLDDWAPFWDVDDEKKIKINDKVENSLSGRWKEWKDKNSYVKRIYSGVLKEEIQGGSKEIQGGLKEEIQDLPQPFVPREIRWPLGILLASLSLLGLATFFLAAS